ncbi:MAG: hypothetical protein JNN12_04110 [Bacteroidetes Order II. Incertae sedis bacterium]|nr:hypothetical protein [Bacteroidetes Order II. bacterium]
MRNLFSVASISLFSLLPMLASAQTPGTCVTGKAEQYLDINNVRARLLNTGGLFWNGDPNVYTVPKGGKANAIFVHSLWLSGYTEENELRVAAAKYGTWEFWPGPLDQQGNPPSDCSAYDRMYKISRSDLEEYQTTRVATKDLSEWPWQLGAPVKDGDGNPNNYALEKGDRPDLLGDQMVCWVMNDAGNVHRSGSKPLGVEVQVTAYAFDTEGDVGNTTFYRYQIRNKSPNRYKEFLFTLFLDADLGYSVDDYVGTDTTRSMVYTYNSDENDDSYGYGYGKSPPALGYDLLQFSGSKEKQQKLGYSMYFFGGAPLTGVPHHLASSYRLSQTARMQDGRLLSMHGDGSSGVRPFTRFFFPGDPITRQGWSELNNNFRGGSSLNGDRIFSLTTHPVSFGSGEDLTADLAIIWARDNTALSSLVALRRASDLVQGFYDAGHQPTKPISAPIVTAAYQKGKLELNWKNDPHGTNPNNDYTDTAYGYKFEGYVVRQYAHASDTKGTTVAIYDKMNGISNIYVPKVGESFINELVIQGLDTGIEMQHIIPSGISPYQDYYFGVQPYAVNLSHTLSPLYWGKEGRVVFTPIDLPETAETPQDVLSRIGISPNPYKGASAYETATNTREVRITGIPKGSTIRIFSLDGLQVKYFWQSEETGYIRWFLENERSRPIASGMYLVHVSIPGVGERVLKFGAVIGDR